MLLPQPFGVPCICVWNSTKSIRLVVKDIIMHNGSVAIRDISWDEYMAVLSL